jgi:GNS1/SUR4 family
MALDSDSSARDWLLMSSPWPTVAICAFYLAASKLLHSWMKRREPIDIRWWIWGFDVFHLVASSSFLSFAFAENLFSDFNFR